MKARIATTGALAALVLGGIGATAFAGVGMPAAASASQGQGCKPGAPTVTVQGQGTAQAPPDQAIIALAVQTQATTAAAAMASNASTATALVQVLLADGVPRSQIQTSGLSVQPNYDNSGTIIISYQVTNSVTVTVNDVARSGTVIDDAARVAGNSVRVNGISFGLRDETPLLSQARTAAVVQASDQANVLATAAGMSLGPLCSLQDNTSLSVPPTTYLPVALPAAAKSPTTPIEGGSEQVTADVTVVYELGPGSSVTSTTT